MKFILSECGGEGIPKRFENALFAYPEDVYKDLRQDLLPNVGNLDINKDYIQYMFLIRKNGDKELSPAIKLTPFGNNFLWYDSDHSKRLSGLHKTIKESGLDIPEHKIFDFIKIDVNIYHLDQEEVGRFVCLDKSESIESLVDYGKNQNVSMYALKKLHLAMLANEGIGYANNVPISLFTPVKDYYFNTTNDSQSTLIQPLIIFQHTQKIL